MLTFSRCVGLLEDRIRKVWSLNFVFGDWKQWFVILLYIPKYGWEEQCCVQDLRLSEPKYHFETDLTKVFNRDVPAVVISQKVQEYFQTNTTPVMTTDSIEEARIIEKEKQIHV